MANELSCFVFECADLRRCWSTQDADGLGTNDAVQYAIDLVERCGLETACTVRQRVARSHNHRFNAQRLDLLALAANLSHDANHD